MSDKITPSEAAKRDVAEAIVVHGGPIAVKISELLRDCVNVLPAPPEAELLARIEALEAENARLRERTNKARDLINFYYWHPLMQPRKIAMQRRAKEWLGAPTEVA